MNNKSGYKEELLPCPFCGCSNVWQYICATAAKVECSDCGASIKDNCVKTTYRTKESLPDWAKDISRKGVHYLDMEGNEVESYWVRPTDSFYFLGITERWNRRSVKSRIEANDLLGEIIKLCVNDEIALHILKPNIRKLVSFFDLKNK